MESIQFLKFRSHHEAVVYLAALLRNGHIKPQKRSAVEWLVAVFAYWSPKTNRAMASHLSYGYSVRPDLDYTDKNDETVRRFSRRMMQRLAKDKVLWVEDKPNRYGTNTIKFSLKHLGFWLEKVSVRKCPPKEVINSNDHQAIRNIVPVREFIASAQNAMDQFVQFRIASGLKAACDKIFHGYQKQQQQKWLHQQSLFQAVSGQNCPFNSDQRANARQSLALREHQAAQRAQQETKEKHVQVNGRWYLESEAIRQGLI